MTLAVDKMDGRGHIITTARREHLPNKTNGTSYKRTIDILTPGG